MSFKSKQISHGQIKALATIKQRKLFKKARNKKLRKIALDMKPMPNKYNGSVV